MEWHYKVEREESFSVQTGQREPCLRVTYRRTGVRRWSRFLLFGEDVDNATVELVVAAIEQHAGVVKVAGS